MQTSKFQLKLYADGTLDTDKAVRVFHAWIRDKVVDDELLIDVADYAHVPDGPGIVLIGHEADYYLDALDSRLGLRYSRKRGLEGDLNARVDEVFRRTLFAAKKLEQELGLKFSTSELHFGIHDRLAAPNNDDTREAVEPALTAATERLLGRAPQRISQEDNPRAPFSLQVQTGVDKALGDLG